MATNRDALYVRDPLGGVKGLIAPDGSTVLRPLVAKIKAGIAAAEKLNPVEAQPWLPPASINTGPGNLIRANSTTYAAGTVVTNAAGTHQFVIRTAGTTAASEPAALTTPVSGTNPYNMGDLADGTAVWAWLGPVRTTTALAGAPSLSSGAKAAQLSVTVAFSNGVAGSPGDSIFQGSASGPLLFGWDRASLFAALVGCDDVSNLGVGGSGFIAGNGTTVLPYIQRIADLVALQPDVVYIGGAQNDGGQGAAIQTAALAYYQAVRAALPSAMIIQAGTYSGSTLAVLQATDAYLQAAVVASGDKNIYFLPTSTDTPTWNSGTGNLGAVANNGSNDIYIGPSDSVHPSQQGTIYLAYKDATAFKALINSIS